MIETGIVVSVENEAAVVSMPMSGGCKNCGICIVGEDGHDVLLLAKNGLGAVQGDTVDIEISSGKVVSAAFIIYMVPVFLTILGFVVGNWITGGAEEAVLPIVLAVIFLVLSFAGVALYDARVRKTETHEATVVRILSPDEVDERNKSIHDTGMGE